MRIGSLATFFAVFTCSTWTSACGSDAPHSEPQPDGSVGGTDGGSGGNAPAGSGGRRSASGGSQAAGGAGALGDGGGKASSGGGSTGSGGAAGGTSGSGGASGAGAGNGGSSGGTAGSGGGGPVTIPPTDSNTGSIPTGTFPFPVWTPDIPKVPPSTTGKTYYVDGAKGDDTHDGTSVATAFKTIKTSVARVAAGDTILILGGLYREVVEVQTSGAAGKPITIGSYGDAEVIIDPSTKVTGWTRYKGNIWQAKLAFIPIGVVVNELVLKQVPQKDDPYGSTAPSKGLADVTAASGKWYFDTSTKTIYADMEPRLGSGDPNTADVIVPANLHGSAAVMLYNVSYVVLNGLTVRGSGGNGVYGDVGSHVTVTHCNVKYNAYHGITFQGAGDTDNQVLLTHVYHNVLTNYPFGNGGTAEAGGGWPAALDWGGNLRPVARGNIVHMNGGEGILSYLTEPGMPSGSGLFEQNVSYDNWSENVYIDNQPNDVVRNNFIFRHPIDLSDYIAPGGTGYPWDSIQKFTGCIALADETYGGNSSAALDHTQVYNNVIVGCRVAISDYSEGPAAAQHAMKNALIANNTIVMSDKEYPNLDAVAIRVQANGGRNTNSFIQNNIIYGYAPDWLVLVASDPDDQTTVATGLQGITVDSNLYYSPTAKPFELVNNSGNNATYAFADWQKFVDGNSRFTDPVLVDIGKLHTAGVLPIDSGNAALQSKSPASGTGASMAQYYTNNFLLAPRSKWNIGAF
jgi:hypothetical protein